MAEQLASKPMLTLSVAKKIAAAAESEAKENGWDVAISIVDDNGNLFYLQRMDTTQIASIEIAIAKAVCAVRYKRPTKVFEDALSGGRQAILKLPDIMPINGGIPITYNGEMLGAIGVSGVQPEQDGKIAQAGTDALLQIIN